MKKFFKWVGIIFTILIVFLIGITIYATLGLNETNSLVIENVDLSKIPNGTYIGSYDCYRWTTKVEVRVENHQITDIEFLKLQDGREDLANQLKEKILNEQKSNVEIISGATASSNGFLKAVENALKGAEVN